MVHLLRGSRLAGATALLASLLLVGASAATAQLPPDMPKVVSPFPNVPSGFNGIFGHRDSRANDVLQYMRCMNATLSAGQGGQLGAIPDTAQIVCMQEKDEWRGLFGALSKDGSSFRVYAQMALRGNGVRTTAPVDTNRAGAIARALQRAYLSPVRGAPKYAFTPIPLHYDQYMEVWFLPVQNSASDLIVGGDSVIQMTLDGRREQGHMEKAQPVRGLPMPAASEYVLDSQQEEVPLISELIAARFALTRATTVRIRTRKFESTLSRDGTWVHMRRRT